MALIRKRYMRNDGKETEKIFDDRYSHHKDVVWYKFVDTFRARNFVPDQPADRMLIYKGVVWLVEIKSTFDLARFPLKNISKKQIGHGRAWTRVGAKEIFIIHKVPRKEFFFVPFSFINTAFEEGRSSVSWDELEVFKEDRKYEFYNSGR